jgi:polysaccharide biosynthesis/export protein
MLRGFVTRFRFLSALTLVLSISVAVAYGQQASGGAQPPASGQTPVDAPLGLMPGDTLTAYFLDFPEIPQKVDLTISPAGNIFIPYAGFVKVAGLTPDQAQEAVINALEAKQVVRSAQVELTVTSARNLSVMVIGAVAIPHSIPLFSPAPLSYVLAQVGALTPQVNYDVLVSHRDGSPPQDVELDRTGMNMRGMNTIVDPGDVVSVVQAGSFFALGEFNHPGIYPITGTQHMTLLQAITVAGGPDLTAELSKARILRNVNGRREEIMVDLAKLHDGKVADPLIQTDDVVFVPRSNLKVVANTWLNSSLYALGLVNTVKNY